MPRGIFDWRSFTSIKPQDGQGLAWRDSVGRFVPAALGGPGGGSAVVGGLPVGTAVRDRMRWDHTRGLWDAVGDSSQVFAALTRTGDLSDLRTAILYFFNNSGRAFPANSDTSGALAFSITDASGRTFLHHTRNQIANVWNVENMRPWSWVASPAHTDWIDGFYLQYSRLNSGGGTDELFPQSTFAVTRDTLEINGEIFDTAKLQVQGDWPGAWRSGLALNQAYHMRTFYTRPSPPPNTVTILDRTRYAVFLENAEAPPDLPTEAQWLAGNTSESAMISAPGGGSGNMGRVAFAIPAHLPSLTIMQKAGISVDRATFTPGADESDVLVTIDGKQKKAYVERSGGPGQNVETVWTLR